MLKKNDVYTLTILDLSSEGSGIAKVDNFIIFIEGALPEDVCEVKIVKLKKTYGYGKIVKIIKNSKFRVESKCEVFKKCGGCSLQHLKYEKQLEIKQNIVETCLKRIGSIENIDVSTTVGMDLPYYYRNKVQFPVGENDKKIEIGFYEKNSHSIVDFSRCLIQQPINEEILKIIKSHMEKYEIPPYNEEKDTGCIRHIFTRVGHITKEIMVCIVVKGNNNKVIINKEEIIQNLKQIQNVTSIVLNYNNNKTNVIMGEKTEVLFGKDHIEDYIGSIKFKISCKSFYQVNSIQTEKLYTNILKFLNVDKSNNVLDVYCGIGTISLFLANYAKKVYGVEVVKEAVNDAIENAKINNIKNAEFILGKAEEVITKQFNRNNIDMAVLDPPRKGCHEDLLNAILYIQPKKIIYVSCNPATLARDLKLICKKDYKVTKVIPYDFFPQTMHVETLVLLEKI